MNARTSSSGFAIELCERAARDDAPFVQHQQLIPSLRALGMLCVTTTSVTPRFCFISSEQPVDFVGGDRIEPGAGLVDEQNLRIERQRSRESSALAHAARELAGILS